MAMSRAGAVLAAVGVSAAVLSGGCSSAGAPQVAQRDPVTGSAAPLAADGAGTPAVAPTAGASAAASAPPPPDINEAPQLPTEQAAAVETFDSCAQRYRQRIDTMPLRGEVTPLLLEEWAHSYAASSAMAAEGDPVGAAAACRNLMAQLDRVVG